MAKKVLIISTSLRGGSNSDILAKECEKGAKEAGHEVEYISLKGKDIKFCIGCLNCQTKGICVLKDDVAEIMEKVLAAEVIVYATPIYYYEMSGQMKTLLDRLNPMYPMDYAFRDIYMIATAAEEEESAFEKAYNGLQGWVDCLPMSLERLCNNEKNTDDSTLCFADLFLIRLWTEGAGSDSNENF